MSTPSPLPHVTIGTRQGRPVLLWDGEPYFYTSYFIRHVTNRVEGQGPQVVEDREDYVRRLAELCRPFAQRGIHGYEVPMTIGWRGPGEWDPVNTAGLYGEPAHDQFRAVREGDPEARVMVNFLIHAPQAWLEAFPEEREWDDQRGMHEVSIGSDRYLEELIGHVQAFVRYVEDKPEWAAHVLTYFFSYGHEGFTWASMSNALGDFSPTMHRCLRAWLREKYNDDEAALREAWQDPEVSFETAAVPTREQQLYADLGWFRDPTGPRQVQDYMECRVDRFVEVHYRLAAAIKEACERRVPVYCFGGYLQVTGWPGSYWDDKRGLAPVEFSPHALSVQTGWRRILECPDIDGWESPYDYYYRQMGGVCLNQSLEQSMLLRGKLFQVNEDTRTFLAAEAGDVYGTVDTREETTAVYRRNFGAIASHWSGCNWMEQISNWLQDEEVLDTLGGFHRLLQKSLEWPETPVEPIGVFLDETSIRYEKPLIDLDWDLVYKQRIFGLSHCGVPFRFHLVDDLLLENMPEYKLNMFLNLFYVDEDRERLIREKVQRAGKTALWMIAPGFCHATEGLSLESMRRLTGMGFGKFDMDFEQWVTISDYTHPITAGLPHDLAYGSDARVGPVFYVEDPEATVLGRRLLFQGRHEPALALKEFPEHRAMYSSVPLLPAGLLRGIARYAGCHVYAEENDVVMAGRGLLTYHTVAPGPRTVKLPEAATVWDLFSGECLGEGVGEVRLEFERPGTKVLTTLEPRLWR